MSADTARPNMWRSLLDEIIRSFKDFRNNPAVFFYLLVCLVLGGAAGLWIPWLANRNEVGTDALGTYVFAVLAPVLADFLLDSGADAESGKELRLFVLFVCMLAGCFALIALFRNNETPGWVSGWFGIILSMVAWMIVVTKSTRFQNQSTGRGSIGGTEANSDNVAGEGLPA